MIRGAGGDPAWSPATGFRYDGLYRVTSYSHEKGQHGFLIYRFELEQITSPPPTNDPVSAELPAGNAAPIVKTSVVQRMVRNNAVSQAVKQLHKHQCQFCHTTIQLPSGPYAEGAHIRPVGKPHHGPDVAENLLCLCPTCHVRFDSGALAITDMFEIQDRLTGEILGFVKQRKAHQISVEHCMYHEGHIATPISQSAPPIV